MWTVNPPDKAATTNKAAARVAKVERVIFNGLASIGPPGAQNDRTGHPDYTGRHRSHLIHGSRRAEGWPVESLRPLTIDGKRFRDLDSLTTPSTRGRARRADACGSSCLVGRRPTRRAALDRHGVTEVGVQDPVIFEGLFEVDFDRLVAVTAMVASNTEVDGEHAVGPRDINARRLTADTGVEEEDLRALPEVSMVDAARFPRGARTG